MDQQPWRLGQIEVLGREGDRRIVGSAIGAGEARRGKTGSMREEVAQGEETGLEIDFRRVDRIAQRPIEVHDARLGELGGEEAGDEPAGLPERPSLLGAERQASAAVGEAGHRQGLDVAVAGEDEDDPRGVASARGALDLAPEIGGRSHRGEEGKQNQQRVAEHGADVREIERKAR